MSKWALRLITFLFSLILGFGANFVRNGSRSISLCEIEASPDKYVGKIVRLRVILENDVFAGGDLDKYSYVSAASICAEDDRPDARVDLDARQITLVPETTYERGKLTERYYFVEAIVTGRFESPDGFTHAAGPKYHISQARIERVIANHVFTSNEQAAQWVKIQIPMRSKN